MPVGCRYSLDWPRSRSPIELLVEDPLDRQHIPANDSQVVSVDANKPAQAIRYRFMSDLWHRYEYVCIHNSPTIKLIQKICKLGSNYVEDRKNQ